MAKKKARKKAQHKPRQGKLLKIYKMLLGVYALTNMLEDLGFATDKHGPVSQLDSAASEIEAMFTDLLGHNWQLSPKKGTPNE